MDWSRNPASGSASSPWVGKLSDLFDAALLSSIGHLLAAGACCGFALTLSSGSIVPALGYLLVSGLAASFFIAPNTKIVLAVPPPAVGGVATATLNTVYNLSLVLGIAVLETILDESLPA